MTRDLLHRLIGQLDVHWQFQLRPKLEGLTDDEYYWEPAPDCWSLRKGADGRYLMDGHPVPPNEAAPFTTIAWRVCHMHSCMGLRERELFHDEIVPDDTYDWPDTAAGALAMLDRGYAAWVQSLRGLGEEGLWQPIGPAAGPYADSPWLEMIMHNNREIIHHGAEVALLRDLYSARGGRT